VQARGQGGAPGAVGGHGRQARSAGTVATFHPGVTTVLRNLHGDQAPLRRHGHRTSPLRTITGSHCPAGHQSHHFARSPVLANRRSHGSRRPAQPPDPRQPLGLRRGHRTMPNGAGHRLSPPDLATLRGRPGSPTGAVASLATPRGHWTSLIGAASPGAPRRAPARAITLGRSPPKLATQRSHRTCQPTRTTGLRHSARPPDLVTGATPPPARRRAHPARAINTSRPPTKLTSRHGPPDLNTPRDRQHSPHGAAANLATPRGHQTSSPVPLRPRPAAAHTQRERSTQADHQRNSPPDAGHQTSPLRETASTRHTARPPVSPLRAVSRHRQSVPGLSARAIKPRRSPNVRARRADRVPRARAPAGRRRPSDRSVCRAIRGRHRHLPRQAAASCSGAGGASSGSGVVSGSAAAR
jgi:hypothetical protein